MCKATSGKGGQYVWDLRCHCSKPFKVSGNKISATRCCPDCSVKRLGERARGTRRGKKNEPTPEIVRLVREAYDYTGADSDKASRAPTLRQIASRTGWKVSALRDLATDLGLSRPESRPLRPWTPKETALVREMRPARLGGITEALRRQGYARSRNEVRDKLAELDHLDHPPRYNARETARLLGFDNPEAVERLAARGKISFSETGDAGEKLVTRREIRRFLLENADDYTLARVDRVFFTMLLLKNSFNVGGRRGRTANGDGAERGASG